MFRSLTFISNEKSTTLSNNRKPLINTIHSKVFTATRLKRFAVERIYTRVILPDILYQILPLLETAPSSIIYKEQITHFLI